MQCSTATWAAWALFEPKKSRLPHLSCCQPASNLALRHAKLPVLSSSAPAGARVGGPVKLSFGNTCGGRQRWACHQTLTLTRS